MFAPTKRNSIANVRAFREIRLEADGFVKGFFTTDDQVALDMDVSVLEAMACPVIEATEPGFLLLTYDLDTQELDTHPVIGWRIRTPYMPEPITPYWDLLPEWKSMISAVQYPDGRVVTHDASFADRTQWLELAKEVRLQWLKEKGPDEHAG